jgi:hypothetical protein
MAAWVEVTTNVLDLTSFFFLTPIVIGRQKFLAFVLRVLVRLEKVHKWLDEVYSGRNWRIGPSHVLQVYAMFGIMIYWQASGRSTDRWSAWTGVVVTGVGSVTLAIFLPAMVALVARIITAVAGKHGIEGFLAVLGVVAFMMARILAITSAIAGG